MTDPNLFDGPTFEPALDEARLLSQIGRVFNLMRDGQWRTVSTIAASTGDPEPSVSAQLRHLRKARWGGHTVNRRRYPGDPVVSGLFQYQLLTNGTLLDGTDRRPPAVACPTCGHGDYQAAELRRHAADIATDLRAMKRGRIGNGTKLIVNIDDLEALAAALDAL